MGGSVVRSGLGPCEPNPWKQLRGRVRHELLGPPSVSRIVIDTHVLRLGPLSAQGPLDPFQGTSDIFAIKQAFDE